jgi:arabinogalactan endo-1,4-beta-galactosidase
MTAFCDQGTPPALVQIGNEITAGLLWATDSEPSECGGGLYCLRGAGASGYETQWCAFTDLLTSAIRGAREAIDAFDAATEVMLHIDRGADADAASWWFTAVEAAGVPFDVIGLSFNPQWHQGAVVSRVARLRRISEGFPSKRLMIAETAYPHRPFECDGQVHSSGEFPFTPAGQARHPRDDHDRSATTLPWADDRIVATVGAGCRGDDAYLYVVQPCREPKVGPGVQQCARIRRRPGVRS